VKMSYRPCNAPEVADKVKVLKSFTLGKDSIWREVLSIRPELSLRD
jgi:hypothetical protein